MKLDLELESLVPESFTTLDIIQCCVLGYGWVIVLSCFVQSMLMDGVINAFGVIYLEVTDAFNASSAEAAWILSLQTCIMGLVGECLNMYTIYPCSHILHTHNFA